ncbi:MAG: GNAT family N-acetyltransferase [Promethearchaeota archaeon]
MYADCKTKLLKEDIQQWGDWYDNYPNKVYLEQAIIRENLFILKIENIINGAVILNTDQSHEWKTINWKLKNPLIIHAFVINPEFQDQGYGKRFLAFCESFARENEYHSIRLDCFIKNEASNKLYKHSGYEDRGLVIFEQKSENNKEYICYEKEL